MLIIYINTYLCYCVYVYIHIYTNMNIYIYIFLDGVDITMYFFCIMEVFFSILSHTPFQISKKCILDNNII